MWFNPIMRGLLRSPLHFFVSKNMMLMTYKGRKSGQSFTVPMNYLAIGDALYTISTRERVWWRNLRAGAQVMIRLQGREVQAWAEAVEDETQVAGSLLEYLQKAPRLARYFGVGINADNEPDPDGIARLAQEKVIVRTMLK